MKMLSTALANTLAKYIIGQWFGEGLNADLGAVAWDWATDRLGRKNSSDFQRDTKKIVSSILGPAEQFLKKESASDEQIRRVGDAMAKVLDNYGPARLVVDAGLDAEALRKMLLAVPQRRELEVDERGFFDSLAGSLAKPLIRLGSTLANYQNESDAKKFAAIQAILGEFSDLKKGLSTNKDILETIAQRQDRERREYREAYNTAIAKELDYVEILGLDDIDRHQREAKLSIAYLSLTMQGADAGTASMPALLGASRFKRSIILIEGGAGSGKSTMLRWVATHANRHSEYDRIASWWQDRVAIVHSEDEGQKLPPIKVAMRHFKPFTNEALAASIFVNAAEVAVSETPINSNFLYKWKFYKAALIEPEKWPEHEKKVYASHTASELDRTPLLIRLRQFPNGQLPPLEMIPNLVCPTIGVPPDGFVTSLLKNGTAILLFDGVDEVPEGEARERVLQGIGAFARTYPDVSIIIASRPKAFKPREFPGLEETRTYRIDDLSSEQQENFIKKWHEGRTATRTAVEGLDYGELANSLIHRLQLDPRLARIAANPLLCAAICALHERQPETLPSDERGLCEKLTLMLLTRDRIQGRADPVVVKEFGREYELSEEKRRQLLAHIAAKMVRGGRSQLDWSEAATLMPRALKEIDEGGLAPETIIRSLAMRSPPLRGCSSSGGGEAVEFVHNRFKEWLASTWFVSDEEFRELVRNAEKEDFAETLVMAAAAPDRRKYAERLIKALLKRMDAEPPRSRAKRALEVLALRAALAAPVLPEELRERIAKLQKKLVPPQSMEEAKALAVAGDAIVPKLKQRPKPRKAEESARCVRCLSIIGTPKAKEMIKTYLKDERFTVLRELARVENPADLPGVWRPKNGRVELPHYLTRRVDRLPSPLPSELKELAFTARDLVPSGAISPLTDLTPLIGNDALTYLDIEYTSVSDLTPIASLSSLRQLFARGPNIEDIGPLKDLTSLRTLSLKFTNVRDLTPISRMRCLEQLYLVGAMAEDIEALSELVSLRALWLAEVPAKSFEPLSGLSSLIELSLESTTVSDLAPLTGLRKLKYLNLGWTKAHNLEPLAGLQDLESLGLQCTAVSDLTPLAALQSLRVLALSGSPATDLTPLADLPALRVLQVSNTNMSDFSPIKEHKSLEQLFVIVKDPQDPPQVPDMNCEVTFF